MRINNSRPTVASTNMLMWGSGKEYLGHALLRLVKSMRTIHSHSSSKQQQYWQTSQGNGPHRLTWCQSAYALPRWLLGCILGKNSISFVLLEGSLGLPGVNEPLSRGQSLLCRCVTKRSSHGTTWESQWAFHRGLVSSKLQFGLCHLTSRCGSKVHQVPLSLANLDLFGLLARTVVV